MLHGGLFKDLLFKDTLEMGKGRVIKHKLTEPNNTCQEKQRKEKAELILLARELISSE